MPALQKFDDFHEQVLRGKHDFGSHTFKVALTNTQPQATNTVLADIAQVAASGGYVAGGYVLDSITVTKAQEQVKVIVNDTIQTVTATVARVRIADEVITAVGGSIGPFRYAVAYNDTSAGKLLVGFVDRGDSITLLDGEEIKVDFDQVAGVLAQS